MPVNIQIARQETDRHPIHIPITVNGHTFKGDLTYNLLVPKTNRSLLIVWYHKYLLTNLLEVSEQNQFREFYDQLTKNLGQTNQPPKLTPLEWTTQFKTVVNTIEAETHKPVEDRKFPGCTAAIYKFGAIPVFISQHEITYVEHGKPYQAKLAFYISKDPNSVDGNSSSVEESESATAKITPIKFHPEFLKSLSINLNLYFVKYFEDIGVVLGEIIECSNIEDALTKAKQVEIILGESVTSKLKALKADSNSNYQFITDNQPVIDTYSTAREFTLYLINILYKLLGITAKLDYGKRLSDSAAKMLGQPLTTNPAIILYIFRVLASNNTITVKEIESKGIDTDSWPIWKKDLINFAVFISQIRHQSQILSLKPFQSRVFLSALHDNQCSDNFNNFTDTVKSKNPKQDIAILRVDSWGGEAVFRELIRTRIWLSSYLVAVLPHDLRHRVTQVTKTYRWIGRESAYAFTLNRSVRFFKESQVDDNQVVKVFSTIDDHLTEDSQIAKRLNQKITESFVRTNYETFYESSFSQRSEVEIELSNKLNRIFKEAREAHFLLFVRGWLNLISSRSAYCLCLINQRTFDKSYMTFAEIKGLSGRLKTEDIKAALSVLSKRTLQPSLLLITRSEPIPYIISTNPTGRGKTGNGRLGDGNKYRGTFRELIDAYFPTYNLGEKSDILEKVMKGFI